MSKRKSEILESVAEAQSVIDDDDDLKSGTRLRLSNALKVVFDTVKQGSEDNEILNDSDVISIISDDSTSRILVRDLPPVTRSYLKEVSKTQAGVLHGASVPLFLDPQKDDFDPMILKDSTFKRMWLDDLREFVACLLVRRHGLVPAPLDDDGGNDTFEDLKIPGTQTSVRDHAYDLVTWEIVTSAHLDRLVEQDEKEPWCLSSEVIMTSVGLSNDEFVEICDLPIPVASVKLARNFVENLEELDAEVETLWKNELYDGMFQESESDMPDYLHKPPRLVLVLSQIKRGLPRCVSNM